MIKLATVFSGIGAIEHALQRMQLDHEIVFACDNGDVEILTKEIGMNIDEIGSELNELSNKIKNISFSDEIKDLYKNQLYGMLNEASNEYNTILSKIDTLPSQDSNLSQKLLKKIISMNNVKASRIKEYKKFLYEIELGSLHQRKLRELQVILEITNDYKKDNSLDNLGKDIEFKSGDNIDWRSVSKLVYSAYKKLESLDGKKIIKKIQDLSQRTSQLHEKINYLDVQKELDSIGDDWTARKQYTKEVDLFVGGSPCQSFSLVGKQRGLDDTRGTLFYEYARLIDEINPKVFIYENVRAVTSHDNGKTWEKMQAVFEELGYDFSYSILNAKNYSIPQNRERLFVVGFRKDLKLSKKFDFPLALPLEKRMKDFLIDNAPGGYFLPEKGVDFVTMEKNLTKRYTQIDGEVQLCQKKNQQFNWHGDFVFQSEEDAEANAIPELEKYFLSEKVRKYVLATGTKNFYSKPKTDLDIARPLLNTMHKMHRAGVDNYVTTDGRLRKLTPRECLRLMGFSDSFKIEVSDTSMYQQAGNSIVVDVLIHIMTSILESYPKLK